MVRIHLILLFTFVLYLVVSCAGPSSAAERPIISKPKVKPTYSIGGFYNYQTTFEDTLLDVARRFNLGFVELIAANPHIDHWVPGNEENVVIPSMHLLPNAPHEGIVINLGDMRLYLFDEVGRPVKSYPIGIGREGLTTPLGSSTVVKKREGPWWYPTKRMRDEDPELPQIVKQGPDNPLGTHILYLGWPTYAIHGTNEPWGIGRRVSSGCMRMYPEDIPLLFEQVDVDTPVHIVDQLYKMAWIKGELYLELHPSKEQATQLEYEQETSYYYPINLNADLEKFAGEREDEINWNRVDEVVLYHTGYPIRITNIENRIEEEKTVVKRNRSPVKTLSYND